MGNWTILIMKLGCDFTKGDGIFLIYGNTYSLDLYMELLKTMVGFLIQIYMDILKWAMQIIENISYYKWTYL